jgi:very-short-patch-repair endonuclease
MLKKLGESLRSRSDAQKAALDTGRKDHPTEGKERSYDDKVKISKSLTAHWASMSDEDRQEKVDQAKARWEALPQSKRDEIYDAAIAAIKKTSSEGSKFEKFMHEKLLVEHTVEFHKKNLIPNENLEIDIYIPRLKTIIEIDGPSHFLPVWGAEKLAKQMRADLDKNGLILSKGFVIIRLKVLKNLSLSAMEDAASQVKVLLESIKSKFPSNHKRYIEVNL